MNFTSSHDIATVRERFCERSEVIPNEGRNSDYGGLGGLSVGLWRISSFDRTNQRICEGENI